MIDCGDTIQGAFLGAYTQGEAGIRFLNCMKYDAWILGNHDLDFGIDRLKNLLLMCSIPVINGNLAIRNFPPFPAYRFYQKANANIAVIGMNASKLEYWLGGGKANNFSNTQATPIVEKILPETMSKNPDMIVAVLHQAYAENDVRKINEIKEIAYRFPQIDLILGGHSHRKIAGKKLGNSWYVQPGHHGKTLGGIIAKIDLEKHRVISIQSTLVESSHSEKRENCDLLTKLIQGSVRGQSKQICFVDKKITSSGIPGVDCHISDIICRAIKWKTGVPVVFHGKLSNYEWNANSYLNELDLFKTIPYENSLIITHLTINEIEQIIEEQLTYKNHRSFNGIHGIYVAIDSQTNQVKTIETKFSNSGNTNDRIQVAFNSYTIAGGGNRFNRLKDILKNGSVNMIDANLNIRDVVREYLINSDTWNKNPETWITFNNYLTWTSHNQTGMI